MAATRGRMVGLLLVGSQTKWVEGLRLRRAQRARSPETDASPIPALLAWTTEGGRCSRFLLEAPLHAPTRAASSFGYRMRPSLDKLLTHRVLKNGRIKRQDALDSPYPFYKLKPRTFFGVVFQNTHSVRHATAIT